MSKRRSRPKNAVEIYPDFPYSAQEYFADANSMMDFDIREALENRSSEDVGEGQAGSTTDEYDPDDPPVRYELNAEHPMLKMVAYLDHKHDGDQELAEANHSVFSLITQALNENRGRISQAGLCYMGPGGMSYHHDLVDRLAKARRLQGGPSDWPEQWLDDEDVRLAIKRAGRDT